jgi:hypothetical protein
MVRETSPGRDGTFKYSKNSSSKSFIHRSLGVVMYINIKLCKKVFKEILPKQRKVKIGDSGGKLCTVYKKTKDAGGGGLEREGHKINNKLGQKANLIINNVKN